MYGACKCGSYGFEPSYGLSLDDAFKKMQQRTVLVVGAGILALLLYELNQRKVAQVRSRR